jgi:hypothetical protein
LTYPHLPVAARSRAAACFRQVRQRLKFVRQKERELAHLQGFRREGQARTCERLRRETRLQLQAMRRLLHALCDENLERQRARDSLQATPLALVLLSHERTRAHVRYTITGTAASEFVPLSRWTPLQALSCSRVPRDTGA